MAPFIRLGTLLVPRSEIVAIDLAALEQGHARVTLRDGRHRTVRANDLIELLMQTKPSALEGRRLRWLRGAWVRHNLLGHPLMQLLAWLGLPKQAIAIHDATIPRPVGFRA